MSSILQKAGADMSAKVTERLEEVRRMSTASGPSAGGRRGYCWTHLLLKCWPADGLH